MLAHPYGVEAQAVGKLRLSQRRADEVRAYYVANGIDDSRLRARGLGEAPDVVDVGPPFAELAREQGLLRSYRVRTWRTIPAAARDWRQRLGITGPATKEEIEAAYREMWRRGCGVPTA